MQVAVLTLGTRGDVYPQLALAEAFKRRGIGAVLAAGREFRTMAEERGLGFVPVDLDYSAYMEEEQTKASYYGDSKARRTAQRDYLQRIMGLMLDAAWEAARGCDALVYHPAFYPAVYAAEKLGVPAIVASATPIVTPTGEFPNLVVSGSSLGKTLNRLSYSARRIEMLMAHGGIARWCRERLGIEPRSRFCDLLRPGGRPLPVLYGYSEFLLPSPRDWDTNTRVCGYWFMESDPDDPKKRLSAEIEHFLAKGPEPVFIGFSSLPSEDGARTARIIVEALELSGQRGIIAFGSGAMPDIDFPETTLAVDYAPHNLLFPRVRAVVHHGGAGSVGASLRAGKPTVVCPVSQEQRFWGALIHREGLGPRPAPQSPSDRFTSLRLGEAIREAVENPGIAARAAKIGAQIRSEDGANKAVKAVLEIIERETSIKTSGASLHERIGK